LSIYVQLFVKAGGVSYLVSSSYILSNANEYNIIILIILYKPNASVEGNTT